jgi:hypothetical protein
MKKIFTFLAAALLTATVWSQSPEKMSYQAVIRDASDNLVTTQTVGVQISILQGSASGTAVYTETQTPTTNANGLISIEIGTGTTSDSFSAIDWSANNYFIKTEIDPTGEANYTITGTCQLLSVPYALYAKTAEIVENLTVDYSDVQNSPDLSNFDSDVTDDFSGNYDDLSGKPTIPDVSGLASQSALEDTASAIRTEIPDVSGFVSSETDPVYTNSQAANITATYIANLSNLSGANTGDQDLSNLATKIELADSTAQIRSEIPDVSGFVSSETDPVYTNSQAANITATYIANLSNLSGANTGDQDLSNLATKIELADSTTQVRSEIPDVSGFLTDETDPVFGASVAYGITATDTVSWNNKLDSYTETDSVYASSEAANITATDIDNLSNLSGTNTGDQDISGITVNTQAIKDSASALRADIFDGDMNNQNITNLADPENAQDAATKAYVDVLEVKVNLLELALENDATSFSISDLLTAGVSVSELLEAGKTVQELIDSGLTADDFKGEFYQGGIIFYLDEDAATGLICAVSDQNDGETAMWSNAVSICNSLTLNGFDDWYLPSYTELSELYSNKSLINTAAGENGGSDFQYTGPYWSSTMMGTSYAYYKFFDDGTKNSGEISSSHSSYYIRAIRAF